MASDSAVRVKDESQWQQQLAEFAADDNPMAQAFQDFVVKWANAAESLLDNLVSSDDTPLLSPMESLRRTLTFVDQGRWLSWYIGMALVQFSTHWEPAGDPDVFFDDMTSIEQRFFRDVAAIKVAKLMKQAEQNQSVGPGE